MSTEQTYFQVMNGHSVLTLVSCLCEIFRDAMSKLRRPESKRSFKSTIIMGVRNTEYGTTYSNSLSVHQVLSNVTPKSPVIHARLTHANHQELLSRPCNSQLCYVFLWHEWR